MGSVPALWPEPGDLFDSMLAVLLCAFFGNRIDINGAERRTSREKKILEHECAPQKLPDRAIFKPTEARKVCRDHGEARLGKSVDMLRPE